MKPAPVRSRSSLTSAAEISAMPVPTPVLRRPWWVAAVIVVMVAAAARRPGRSRLVSAGDRGLVALLGRFTGQLRGDLLSRCLRRLGDGRLGTGGTVTRQEVVVIVDARVEGEGSSAGKGGNELVGGAGDLLLGLRSGHRLHHLGLGAASRPLA